MKIIKKLLSLALTLILSLTLVTLSPVSAMASAPSVGGIVTFGTFQYAGWDENYNDVEIDYAVEWRVLDVQGDMMLLLSDKLLFEDMYHYPNDNPITWEECSLRKKLNRDFYNSTFSEDEKARIVETTIINKDNQWYGTPGGNNTVDKIFLLSLEEVVKYFGDNGQLSNRPAPDSYRIMDNNSERTAEMLGIGGSEPSWWLRSPGGGPRSAAAADYSIEVGGLSANGNALGVRPAMWVKLDGTASTLEIPAAPIIDTAPVNTVPASAPADIPASSNYNPGDYLGDVLYSDIMAYINGYPIPTSATNGRTMVVAEDLANYGFTVIWDAASWSLSITPGSGAAFNPLPVEQNTMPVGSVKCPYVYTTVKTFLSGAEVESFAIDGRTLIDFELLAKYGQIEWSNAERSLRLTVN